MTTLHSPPEPRIDERSAYGGYGGRTQGNRSVASLIMDLRDEATNLIKNEIRLAKAELTDKAQDVKKGAISGLTGGAITYAGALMLLVAAAAGLYALMREMDVSPFVAGWLAPLIVGGITLLIGLGMLAAAKNKMSADHLRPDRTRRSLEETRDWAGRTAERTADHLKGERSEPSLHETRDWSERKVT